MDRGWHSWRLARRWGNFMRGFGTDSLGVSSRMDSGFYSQQLLTERMQLITSCLQFFTTRVLISCDLHAK